MSELMFQEQMIFIDTDCQICGCKLRLHFPASVYENIQTAEHVAATIAACVRIAVHDECIDDRVSGYHKKAKADQIALQIENRNKYWEGICPPEFRVELDWTNKACRRNNFDRVMAWRFGPMGFIAHGRSGQCKTRFIYHLLKREHDDGKTIMAMRHQQFRMTISRLASDSQAALGRFMMKLCTAQILFLDDLGKGTLTPASEEALSEVIDHRGSNNRPIFYSTNDDFKTLAGRLSVDRGAPILRRILDKSVDIHFD